CLPFIDLCFCSMSSLIAMLVLALFICLLQFISAQLPQAIPFEIGDSLPLECFLNPLTSSKMAPVPGGEPIVNPNKPVDPNATWLPVFQCIETGTHLQFQYGTESFIYCGLTLSTPEQINFINNIIQQKEALQCRMPMSKDK